MAKIGQITGPPGSGKTTSLELMNPKKLVICDADRNGPSWAG